MMYALSYTPAAEKDMSFLKYNQPKAYKKLVGLLNELMEHPRTGTGHPEQLKGDRSGQWSRTITKKHRLVYAINDDTVVVLAIAAYGHYNDK